MSSARIVAAALVALASFAPAAASAEPTWATERAADLTRMGRDHAAHGDASAAARRYLDALSSDPTYGPAYLALGALYEGTGDVKEAERAYAMGIERVVGFAEARLARAHLYASLRRMPEAIVDLEAASAQRSDDEAVLGELVRAYVTTGALPAALSATRRLVVLAEVRGDARAEATARTSVRALTLLVADADPVLAGRLGRGVVRRAIADVAGKKN